MKLEEKNLDLESLGGFFKIAKISDFGNILKTHWKIKKKISISNPFEEISK